jgi:hypothetical protein
MAVNRRNKMTAPGREWCARMEIGGTYPMLYAFFDEAGALRRDASSHRIGASIASRIPSETATPTWLAWAERYAAELGPIPV